MAIDNPLLPTVGDAILASVCMIAAAYALVALVFLAISSRRLRLPELIGWFFIIALVPVIGPSWWFAAQNKAVPPAA